jgi:hypothetical protein
MIKKKSLQPEVMIVEKDSDDESEEEEDTRDRRGSKGVGKSHSHSGSKEEEASRRRDEEDKLTKIQEQEDDEEKSGEGSGEAKPSALATLRSRLAKHHALIHPTMPPNSHQEELLLHAASLWVLPPSQPASLEPSLPVHSQGEKVSSPPLSTPSIPSQSQRSLVVVTDPNDPATTSERNGEGKQPDGQGNESSSSTPSSRTTSLRSSFLELKNSPTVSDLKPLPHRPRRLSPLKLQPTIAERKSSSDSSAVAMEQQSSPQRPKTQAASSVISGPQLDLLTDALGKKETKINLKRVIYKPGESVPHHHISLLTLLPFLCP